MPQPRLGGIRFKKAGDVSRLSRLFLLLTLFALLLPGQSDDGNYKCEQRAYSYDRISVHGDHLLSEMPPRVTKHRPGYFSSLSSAETPITKPQVDGLL